MHNHTKYFSFKKSFHSHQNNTLGKGLVFSQCEDCLVGTNVFLNLYYCHEKRDVVDTKSLLYKDKISHYRPFQSRRRPLTVKAPAFMYQ